MPLEPHPTDPDKMVFKKPNYNFGWLQTEDIKDLEDKYKLQEQNNERRFERLERTIILLPLIIYVFTFINTAIFLLWIFQ